MLIASARTWTAAELTPALSSSNSASGAHSAVANVLLTPFRPPQVTELISVRRTGRPARLALRTAPSAGFSYPGGGLCSPCRAPGAPDGTLGGSRHPGGGALAQYPRDGGERL